MKCCINDDDNDEIETIKNKGFTIIKKLTRISFSKKKKVNALLQQLDQVIIRLKEMAQQQSTSSYTDSEHLKKIIVDFIYSYNTYKGLADMIGKK